MFRPFLLALSLSLLAIVGAGCASSTKQSAGADRSIASEEGEGRAEWVRSDRAARSGLKGVAISVHGLNAKSAKMADLNRLLNSEGIDVVSVTLSGHTGDTESFARVSRSKWLDDMRRGYRMARAEADGKRVPLYFVGFSLGAAVGMDLATIDEVERARFDKIVLLAPAIKVRPHSYLVNLLQIAGPSFTIPTLNHPDYVANRGGTTMAAYRGLFDSIGAIGDQSIRVANVPTLIVMDPEDELVSLSGIRSLIRNERLDNWRILETSTGDTEVSPSYHHLIIDSPALGRRIWSNVAATIRAHLKGDPLPEPLTLQSLCATAKRWRTTQNASCRQDWHPGCDRSHHQCLQILER